MERFREIQLDLIRILKDSEIFRKIRKDSDRFRKIRKIIQKDLENPSESFIEIRKFKKKTNFYINK